MCIRDSRQLLYSSSLLYALLDHRQKYDCAIQCTMRLLLIVLIPYLVVAYHSFAILRLTVHEDDLIERLQLCVIIPLLQLSFRQAVAILLEAQLLFLRIPGYLHFQIEEMSILILQHHI